MSMRWAKNLPYWPPYKDAESTYDLSHLNPFRYQLELPEKGNHPARQTEIRVAFSAHTFTVGCVIAEGPHLQYSGGQRDLRRFCPDRYRLSKLLPDVIRNLNTCRCFFAPRENFFVVEVPGGLPPESEYWVFFDVRGTEDPGAVIVRVQSAYVGHTKKLPGGLKAKKVGFAVLVNKALRDERATPPP